MSDRIQRHFWKRTGESGHSTEKWRQLCRKKSESWQGKGVSRLWAHTGRVIMLNPDVCAVLFKKLPCPHFSFCLCTEWGGGEGGGFYQFTDRESLPSGPFLLWQSGKFTSSTFGMCVDNSVRVLRLRLLLNKPLLVPTPPYSKCTLLISYVSPTVPFTDTRSPCMRAVVTVDKSRAVSHRCFIFSYYQISPWSLITVRRDTRKYDKNRMDRKFDDVIFSSRAVKSWPN